MIDVFLLLGSNLGDRQGFLREAISHIETDIAPVVQKSGIYETESWGKQDAPDYLNQVILIKTIVAPQVLLQKILNIENVLGRIREEKWGSHH